jgi:uncharacterized membrane protein
VANSQPDRQPAIPRTFQENLELITRWEQEALEHRSRADRLSDWMTRNAARGPVLLGHVMAIAIWLLLNSTLIGGLPAFDPFPFPKLVLIVSLESLLVALFVLASQNRLAIQADKRAHLDLQINLLAEREMTAMLQLLRDIANQLGVAHTVPQPTLSELAQETNVQELASKIEENVSPDT